MMQNQIQLICSISDKNEYIFVHVQDGIQTLTMNSIKIPQYQIIYLFLTGF